MIDGASVIAKRRRRLLMAWKGEISIVAKDESGQLCGEMM